MVNKNANERIKQHEAGHGVQNIMFGPLMPFLVSIPSAIRYWHREYIYRTNRIKYRKLPSYYSIWFERDATDYGMIYFN